MNYYQTSYFYNHLNQNKMKSKTTYRITIFDKYCLSLVETLAILAAKSNGSENKYSLNDLKNVAEVQKILYPSSNGNTTCEIIGNNILHLDWKIGDDYQTTLIIEQVELFSLADETAPSLNRHNDINNADFHECIN